MIPRIIHYCWFSGDPYPPEVQQCIDSWHQYMPEWEFRLWDAASIASIDSQWLRECLAARKWAFAADYIRLYAVSHFGGIYLDCDCRVHHSLEPFLSHQAFIGREWYVHIDCFTTYHYLTSHCFGAQPNHPFVERCLAYYSDRHFQLSAQVDLPDFLRYDQRMLPEIQCTIAAQEWGYAPVPSRQGIQNLTSRQTGSELVVYPYNYFNCYDFKPYTYVQHLAMGGWYERFESAVGKKTVTSRIRFHLHKWFLRFLWRRGFILTPKQ